MAVPCPNVHKSVLGGILVSYMYRTCCRFGRCRVGGLRRIAAPFVVAAPVGGAGPDEVAGLPG